MFKVGDNVIYKPNDWILTSVNHIVKDEKHRWYNAKAKIIATETLDRFWIAYDEFPNCNSRDRVNRFLADTTELELY